MYHKVIQIVSLSHFFITIIPTIIQRKKRRNTTKVDQNDFYGMYYDANGDRIDQRVSEVVDTNFNYG